MIITSDAVLSVWRLRADIRDLEDPAGDLPVLLADIENVAYSMGLDFPLSEDEADLVAQALVMGGYDGPTDK